MKDKHLRIRINQLLALSEASTCCRRKFAAMIIDPVDNVVTADGFNGPPRGAKGDLCGGDICDRYRLNIESGTRLEIGCSHSEFNAIMNAARQGAATRGKHMIVTGEPCTACAKAIHHAGLTKVYCVKGGYLGAGAGIDYLNAHGVAVQYVDGPQDPRGEK